jgi:vacuolar protein sorting-associated protein 26
MSYFFSTPVDIDIVLEDTDDRSMVDVKLDKNRREKAPLFMDGESVKGAVTVRPKDGKRLEHTGIKVQFIGTIGMDEPLERYGRMHHRGPDAHPWGTLELQEPTG